MNHPAFRVHENIAFVQELESSNLTVYIAKRGNPVEKLTGADATSFLPTAEANNIPIIQLGPQHLVLERGLDLQAHLRFPGQSDKETLEGGLNSAFFGGFDSVVAMPNTKPFLDTPARIQDCLAQISASNIKGIKVGQTAAGTLNMSGNEASDIGMLKQAGCVAITDDGWGIASDEIQAEVFKRCAEHDLLFMQHAERPGHGGVTPKSAFQAKFNLPIYPDDAESWMVKRDVELLKRIPEARYHVLHVTTEASVEEIAKAKQAGLNITSEVSPHHLMFCNEDIPDIDDPRSTFYKMNPPLFSRQDRDALRAALNEGIIDCMATDHAPHKQSDKSKGWIDGPFGTRGLETALPVLSTFCHKGVLPYEKLETYFSTKPREILQNKKFSQADGFVILDKTQKWTVQNEDLPGISQNSIFLGHALMGKIVAIMTSNGSHTQL